MGGLRNADILARELKGREHFEDLGVDGGAITKDIKRMVCNGMDWIHLAPDRYLWRAVLNTVEELQAS
jgi:hypothetical protein